jgi:hypothetical protein
LTLIDRHRRRSYSGGDARIPHDRADDLLNVFVALSEVEKFEGPIPVSADSLRNQGVDERLSCYADIGEVQLDDLTTLHSREDSAQLKSAGFVLVFGEGGAFDRSDLYGLGHAKITFSETSATDTAGSCVPRLAHASCRIRE